MTQKLHRIHTSDTRTVLSVTLQQPNSSGVLTAVDLTGLTMKFKMINRADGTTAIALTTTGVSVVVAASGTVNYDFSAAGVLTAGMYNGYFVAETAGTETDHFPARQDGLRIAIDSDTQTAEQAYAAAVAA